MTTAPNQRWFRFSLRTLFVVVAICAWLGLASRRAQREELRQQRRHHIDMIYRYASWADEARNSTLSKAWPDVDAGEYFALKAQYHQNKAKEYDRELKLRTGD